MEELDYYIRHHVELLIDAYAQHKQGQMLPIDLQVVAQLRGASVEEREMIPEAVMTPHGAQFQIFLQNNFQQLPGVRIRQRFSLGHEIGHTLFFEPRDGKQVIVKRAPVGSQLEAACDKAAEMILMPDRFFLPGISDASRISAELIVDLSRTFDVSLQAALRRVRGTGVLDSVEVAFVLVHDGKIDYPDCPSWVATVLPTPQRGLEFKAWFQRGADHTGEAREDGSFMRVTELGPLRARRVVVSGLTSVFEIRLGSPVQVSGSEPTANSEPTGD